MLTTARVAGGVLAMFALLVLFESRRYPLGSLHSPGPGYMPVLLALLLLLFGIALVASGRTAASIAEVGWRESRHAAAILGACAFAALALERLGYRITVLLVMVVLLGVVERRRPLITAAVSLGIALGSFHLFSTVLRVPLPRGPLGW
jgi:hypothetical protein